MFFPSADSGSLGKPVSDAVGGASRWAVADLHTATEAIKNIVTYGLINPLQALHPNSAAPSDNMLVDGGRRAGVDRDAYAEWLHRLAEVCRERGIVLILDDVFTGFRLARGGAAEYFGIRPDMVTFGKTLGGGLPNGVLVGKAALMKRYREDRPADICFARGTFNAHPYVMASMNAFLRKLDEPETAALYDGLDERWNARAAWMNTSLAAADVPVRVANLSSIWTVLYHVPSRFNWMLQYYLREEGLLLSWVGTGRLIFSLNYTDADFEEVVTRFTRACERMAANGWWWHAPDATNKGIRRGILRELIAKRLGR